MSFKIFEKLPAISLYWFAVQEETNAFRRKNKLAALLEI